MAYRDAIDYSNPPVNMPYARDYQTPIQTGRGGLGALLRRAQLGDYMNPIQQGRGGLGNMSASGQYGSSELQAKITEALGKLSTLLQSVDSAKTAYNSPSGLSQIQQVGVKSAVDDAQNRVGSVINSIQQWAQDQQTALKGIQIPPPVPSSFPISDAAWHNVNDTIEPQIVQQASALKGAVDLLPAIYANALDAAKKATDAAKAIADKAAFDAGNAANQRVTTAIINAQSFAQQGNYAGALAQVQNPSIIADATSIGRQNDLSTAVTAINGAQQQAQAALDAKAVADKAAADRASQSQAACTSAGGMWNGYACDMSAVNKAAADKAAADLLASQAQQSGFLTTQQQQQQAFELQLEQMKEASASAAADRAAAAQQAQLQFQSDQAKQAQALQLLAPLLSGASSGKGFDPATLQIILQVLGLAPAASAAPAAAATPPDGTPATLSDGTPAVWQGGQIVPLNVPARVSWGAESF